MAFSDKPVIADASAIVTHGAEAICGGASVILSIIFFLTPRYQRGLDLLRN